MGSITTMLIAAVVFIQASSGQSWVNVLTKDEYWMDLEDIHVIDGGKMVAVGTDTKTNSAMIVSTSTAFDGYTVTLRTETNMFCSVSFADNLHGWIVGQHGAILYSSDGGKSWSVRQSPADVVWRSVDCVGSEEAWIVGDDCAIFHTVDAGKTWIDQSVSSGFGFMSVCFVDSLYGWAAGGAAVADVDSRTDIGEVFHTEDGGASWNLQQVPKSPFLYSVFFIDRSYGWAVGGSMAGSGILHTTDGGQTWVMQNGPEVEGLGVRNSVYFIDQNEGWVAGHIYDAILHTTDGGETWTAVTIPENPAIYSIFLTGRNSGWAVGSGVIMHLYETSATHERHTGLSEVYYLPDRKSKKMVFCNLRGQRMATDDLKLPNHLYCSRQRRHVSVR